MVGVFLILLSWVLLFPLQICAALHHTCPIPRRSTVGLCWPLSASKWSRARFCAACSPSPCPFFFYCSVRTRSPLHLDRQTGSFICHSSSVPQPAARGISPACARCPGKSTSSVAAQCRQGERSSASLYKPRAPRRPSGGASEVPRAHLPGAVLPGPSAAFHNLTHSCIFLNELGPEPQRSNLEV